MNQAATNRQTASSTAPQSSITHQSGSKVEQYFLAQSRLKLRYAPVEKISIIEVADFPTLGRLTALRFLEWALDNPRGVISLPTGKTPEYFIHWTKHFLQTWDAAETRRALEPVGLSEREKPELSGLIFVQIDEFYPIEPGQHNSFHHYVTKNYLRGFGLNIERALLIDPTRIGVPEGLKLAQVYPDGRVDLSLRSRQASNALEELQQRVIAAVDQFCSEYEARIRELGGIGFFLGGIGPDGHIGFNARGSHQYSPTRLTLTNYETEAAAAGDLGGIEVSRGKPVITIGLGTITHKPDATVLIFAAGEGKARVVADAAQQERNVLYPATALHNMRNARLYITGGAAVRLAERNLDKIIHAEAIPEETLERAVIELALREGKRLDELRERDARTDRLLASILLRTERKLDEAAGWTRERLEEKLRRGLEIPDNRTFLHTGPHHDDISLGYKPQIMHLVRRAENRNYFCVLTSGFTAVTNRFLFEILQDLAELLERGEFAEDQRQGAFFPENRAARSEEVYRFLDGIAGREPTLCKRAQSRRMLFNLMGLYDEDDLEHLKLRIDENLHYLRTLYPGKKDIPLIQKMKGMQREFEEELIWGYVGTAPANVFHLRLGFYTGDVFTLAPTIERDVEPALNLLLKLQPDVVSLAFDPEGAGPDTHYKVLQVLHEALLRYRRQTGQSPRVWGYRNVWFRFHPSEANLFVPATLNTMAVTEHSFMNCFGSQKSASFPSFEYDGPFCELATRIWVEQFRGIRACLGERWFIENPHPRLRATRGLIFLKEMTLDDFSGRARRLAQATEAL